MVFVLEVSSTTVFVLLLMLLLAEYSLSSLDLLLALVLLFLVLVLALLLWMLSGLLFVVAEVGQAGSKLNATFLALDRVLYPW